MWHFGSLRQVSCQSVRRDVSERGRHGSFHPGYLINIHKCDPDVVAYDVTIER